MPSFEKIKVVIADSDHALAQRLSDYASHQGFECRVAVNGAEARALILEWKPRLIVADLVLPGLGAVGLLDWLKGEAELRHHIMHMIVISAHNSEANVRQAFARGARDYLIKPLSPAELVKRMLLHCRSYRNLDPSVKATGGSEDAGHVLYLTDLVLKQAIAGVSLSDTLFNLTRMVSLKMNGVRCSIVHCLDHERGVVVASNDDRSATGIPLDLNKYPEILQVINTQSLVAIENLSSDLKLKEVRAALQEIQFNSLIVCPVTRARKPFGVLSLRMPEEKQVIADNEIRFTEIVSHVASLVLSRRVEGDRDFWLETSHPSPLRRVLPFHKK